MGTVVKLKNQINDSYFQLKESVEEKLIFAVGSDIMQIMNGQRVVISIPC